MSQDITPKQALLLWRLLTARTLELREPMQSKAKPELSPKERQELVDKGYLNVDRRRVGRATATYLVLTDKAWAWAERTHGVEVLQSNSKLGAQVLQDLLAALLPFLSEHELPLASVFSERRARPDSHDGSEGAAPNPAPKAEVPPFQDTPSQRTSPRNTPLSERIERACLELTGGRRQQRVRLRDLRAVLDDVPRDALDRALLQLQDEDRAVLYRDDNTAALSDADHAAALLVADAPRHLIYLEA